MKKITVFLVLLVSVLFISISSIHGSQIIGTDDDDHYMRAGSWATLVDNFEMKHFLWIQYPSYDTYDAPEYDIYEINGQTFSADAYAYTVWTCDYCGDQVIASGNPGDYYYNHVYFYVYGEEVEKVWQEGLMSYYQLKEGAHLKFTDENTLPGMRFRNPYSTIY